MAQTHVSATVHLPTLPPLSIYSIYSIYKTVRSLIRSLNTEDIPDLLTQLRVNTLDNAILIGNLLGCREECAFLVKEHTSGRLSTIETFRQFPFSNFNLFLNDVEDLPPLLETLIQRNPVLRNNDLYSMLPETKVEMVKKHYEVVHEEDELKMVLEEFVPPVRSSLAVVRLCSDHRRAATTLAAEAGLSAWYEGVFDRGPMYGCFSEDGQLVAMAGNHYVTKYISEIGHVATHPDFRRQGLASACIGELAKELKGLTETIMLMVSPTNAGAVTAYRKLGFRHHQTLKLIAIRP